MRKEREKKKYQEGSLFLLADVTTWCLSHSLHNVEFHSQPPFIFAISVQAQQVPAPHHKELHIHITCWSSTFDSLTANKYSSKHNSGQNTEEGRRCVATHCSYHMYRYYIGTGMIAGKGLYSHTPTFTPLNTGAPAASWY